jgi:hypothetical protein
MNARLARAGEALWRRLTVPEKARRRLLDEYATAVLHAAADRLRARGNEVAAAPPDKRLDPRAGVNILVAEGWYQAADQLRPKETP